MAAGCGRSCGRCAGGVPPSVVQKYPTSSRSFSDPKDTRSTKKQPLFFQYEWIDTAGQLRFPTGLELRTATRRAVAPDGLLEDIRSNRGRRGREASLRTPAGA